MSVNICLSFSVCQSMYVNLSLSVSVCQPLSVSLSLSIYVCQFPSVNLCLSIYLCQTLYVISVCQFASVNLCMSISICLCLPVNLHISVSILLNTYHCLFLSTSPVQFWFIILYSQSQSLPLQSQSLPRNICMSVSALYNYPRVSIYYSLFKSTVCLSISFSTSLSQSLPLCLHLYLSVSFSISLSQSLPLPPSFRMQNRAANQC